MNEALLTQGLLGIVLGMREDKEDGMKTGKDSTGGCRNVGVEGGDFWGVDGWG